MNIINIAIECDLKHKAAIYTLATSVVLNKSENSVYNIIFLLDNTEEKEWIELKELENNNVKVSFENEYVDLIDKVDKVICLKWNTLVMGDLTRLFELDMEGKCIAMSRNFPEVEYSMSNGKGYYDDSVCMIDATKEYEPEKCKELPIFYNLAYDEIAKEKVNKYKNDIKLNKDELTELKEWALIIRYDKEHSPDKFFDSALSEVWMKYYRLSPKRGEKLYRDAYAETMGTVCVDTDKAVPVLIPVDDKSVVNAIALIHSLEKSISTDRQIDVRLAYTQLSNKHKNMLLAVCSQRVSIVLYNIKAWKFYDKKIASVMLVAQIFTSYKKALFLNNNVICNEKIEEFFDEELTDNWIALNKVYENVMLSYSDTFFTSGIDKKDDKTNKSNKLAMLVNIDGWLTNGICDIICQMLNSKANKMCDIVVFIGIVCAKKTKWLDNADVWNITEDNQEEYIKYIKECLYQILSEEDVEKEMKYITCGDDDKVREIIEKIQQLEESNAKIIKKNKLLEKENEILSSERNQFLYEILEIRKSFTYRVGRMITFIPRLLRGKR